MGLGLFVGAAIVHGRPMPFVVVGALGGLAYILVRLLTRLDTSKNYLWRSSGGMAAADEGERGLDRGRLTGLVFAVDLSGRHHPVLREPDGAAHVVNDVGEANLHRRPREPNGPNHETHRSLLMGEDVLNGGADLRLGPVRAGDV